MSTSKPRFVTGGGLVIAADGVSAGVDGLHHHDVHGVVTRVERHTNHGGVNVVACEQEGWWVEDPSRVESESRRMAIAFPAFRFTERNGTPVWTGTINNGYGRFEVEMEHRADGGRPVARVLNRRLERKQGRRYVASPHLFLDGSICYAGIEDLRPGDGHDMVTAVAWVANWLMHFAWWQVSGLWPKGEIGGE